MALEQVSTFVLPNEYQRQATEARRRRRMAEMLAQQAYQPSDISAPIPTAAPLVQGLQAFLAARAERKADEAEEAATKAGTQEARDFLRALTEPEKKLDVGQAAVESIKQMGTPELVDGRLEYRKTAMPAPTPEMIPQAGPQVRLGRKPEDDQIYMPTATGRETDPQRIAALLANPQMKAGFTDEQRRSLALEGMLTSQNPMLQKVAGAIYPTLQPEKPKLQLGNIDPAKFTPASIADAMNSGDISKLQLIAPESAALTPLSKMLSEREARIARNPNDPNIAILTDAIKKEIAPARGTTVNVTNRYGAPISAVDAEGNPVFIQPSQTGGPPSVLEGFAPPASKAPPMTEGQANAAGFANRIASALPSLQRLSPPRSAIVAEGLPLGLGASQLTDKDQQFFQAERNFITAILRRESGAAISPSEFESARRQYIPQPGDGPETLKQKARERSLALENMRRSAGPAYEPSEIIEVNY